MHRKSKEMKKSILFIVLTLLVLTSNAQEYKEHYNNGKTKVIGTKKNKLETGNWKYYFKNGKISKTGNYLEGKLHGEWKYYYDSGVLRIIGKYKKGKDKGLWKYYHDNGALRAIGKYKNGKFTGEWKYYYKNSTLSKTGKRKQGIDVGSWKYFNEDGTLNKIEEKENDKKQIERILSYYFEGTKTDNPDLLKKAFQPDATLKFINKKGEHTKVAIQTFFSYFKNMKTRLFKSKIYYIDVTGTTANVKLSTKYKTYQYMDYMNILKTKEGWKIVNKISHQEFF
ncbi:nuclear transport factor 2 family protein [Tenacibaculum retecalamus]|uniref:nuclear transport factor 2 family protein n=1 Tax=Tenacibaculum retecalamus TaxID=3018315 RepID=UPI0023D9075E|nr:nuclear transport factor 2 family protein [Tenacibaculum retecalamus]WBX71096.1 nuclear transport factor 2 family protein [Tenacibaculum retecalamus]